MKWLKVLAHVVILLVIFAIGIGPWISVAIAGTIAESNGCQLDEGSVHLCMVNGRDVGETLYTMGMMGWVGIATCPVALILLGVYVLVIVTIWLVRRNRAKKA
jgi:TRAP-type C4-dicarboxylate transport system permease small subunit